MSLPLTVTTATGQSLLLRRDTAKDAECLIAAVDQVTRERRFFLRSSFAVTVEREREFIQRAEDEGNLVLLAELDGSIVGWVLPRHVAQEYRRHAGELGIGVLAPCRGIGVGSALLEASLAWAAGAGFERIELGVRASNPNARRLYERFRFQKEGYSHRAVKDERGEYDDIVHMARLL